MVEKEQRDITTIIASAGVEIGVEHSVVTMDGQSLHDVPRDVCVFQAASSRQAPVVEIWITGYRKPVMYTQLPGEHP